MLQLEESKKKSNNQGKDDDSGDSSEEDADVVKDMLDNVKQKSMAK